MQTVVMFDEWTNVFNEFARWFVGQMRAVDGIVGIFYIFENDKFIYKY